MAFEALRSAARGLRSALEERSEPCTEAIHRHRLAGVWKFWIPVVAALSVLAVVPGSASAIQAGKSLYDSKPLRGSHCGRHYAVGFTLSRRAHAIRIFGPRKGKTLRDLNTGRRVARVTGRIRLRFHAGRKFVGIGYVSRGAACKNRNRVRHWHTRGIRLRVAFRRKVRVFVKFGGIRQRKPDTLFFGANEAIYGMRWSEWDRRTVYGYGTWDYNDCIPSCAAGHLTPYPASVKLSRPRNCGGVFFYARLRARPQAGPGRALTLRTFGGCRYLNGRDLIRGPEVRHRRADRRRLR